MRLLDGLKVYHKVLASLSRQEPSRLCFVCFSRPLPFSHPRSASMPIHSAVCQEDRENGSHDKGISMEMDEVNSSFSRLSLSPSFDWPFFSFFFSRLLLSMTRVGSLISFPRTLSLFGLSLSLSLILALFLSAMSCCLALSSLPPPFSLLVSGSQRKE